MKEPNPKDVMNLIADVLDMWVREMEGITPTETPQDAMADLAGVLRELSWEEFNNLAARRATEHIAHVLGRE